VPGPPRGRQTQLRGASGKKEEVKVNKVVDHQVESRCRRRENKIQNFNIAMLTKPPEERLSLLREPSGAMEKNSVREKQLRLKKTSGFQGR
jgi:hypothetical protein